MEHKTGNMTRKLIILNLATVSLITYLISVFAAYPIFQQTRVTDPLAELHSLSPLYYFAIAISVMTVLGCFIWQIGNKYLHIFLLMMLAAMLWLTPYWLSGFVRLPDASWHVGIAMQIPQVLNGDPVAFSSYGWGYPGSFVYHYSWVNITGIQPLTYISFFPLFAMLLFILLGYVLITRLFNPRVAVLSLLLAIPGLHYIQLHASPHIIGALLMLTVLVLLVKGGKVAVALAIIVIAVIIFSHPTTPLLLSIFLAATLLTMITYTHKINRFQLALAGVLIITLIGWFFFYGYAYRIQPFISSPIPSANQNPPANSSTLYNKLIGKILPSDLDTSGPYLSGTPFIFRDIYNLNKGIYLLYAAIAISLLLYIAVSSWTRKRNIRGWLSSSGGLNRSEVLLLISIPLLFILTVLLAEGSHDLLETGLTYIILALSCIIASIIVRLRLMKTGIGPFIIMVGILFFAISYPIVAYSIDAYSNVPKSEEEGLKFLAAEVTMKNKAVAGSFLSQLSIYAPPYSSQTRFVELDLNKSKADVAVFRNTGYYYRSLRFDMSFQNNTYTRSLAQVQTLKYDQIYTSPTFQVFLSGNQNK